MNLLSDIKHSLTQCITYVMEKDEITIEQKGGIITLQQKKVNILS